MNNPSMTSGTGQFHTNEPDPKNPSKKLTPYLAIGCEAIKAMVDKPQQCDKALAQWLIPSSLPSRNFKKQEQRGEYWMLWADLDKNPPTLSDLYPIVEGILGGCDFELYNSRSATVENQKCRALIFLDETLCFADWNLAQQILNDNLEALCIIPDRAAERAAQLCYLPNRGAFYCTESIRKGKYFDPMQSWEQEIAAKREKIEAERVVLETARLNTMAKRAALKLSDAPGLIGAFNLVYTPLDWLIKAGYSQKGETFRHPNSETGNFSASVKADTNGLLRVNTLSSSDPLFNNGAGAHDVFSTFCTLFHGGDKKAALKDAGDNLLTIGCVSWNKAKQREYAKATPQQQQQQQQAYAKNTEQEPPDEQPPQYGESRQSDEEVIKTLATLSPLDFDRQRTAKAKQLGVQVKTLDALVKAERADKGEAKRLPFPEIEPYEKPIQPSHLLDEIAATIQKFIVLDSVQADAAALWIAFTWFIDVVEVAPLAIINAPEKSCGKTQLLTVVGRMAYRPLHTSNASPSALFRAVDLWKPTILIDEADTFFKDNPELHGMVNAGYLRDGFVLRSEAVGDTYEPRVFPVFSAKAIAGVRLEQHLPDTTMSRGIVFNLRRKLLHESVSRLRHAGNHDFSTIAAKLSRFAADYSQKIREARPLLPDQLNDRDQDNWEGLLSVASCASDEWLERATAAALKMSVSEKTHGVSNELLTDIQAIFEFREIKYIRTTELISALCEDEENAWLTYNRGKPITARQVNKQMAAYGIVSKQIRINAIEKIRGFELSQFSDAFKRYLVTHPENSRYSGTDLHEPSKHAAYNGTDTKICTGTIRYSDTYGIGVVPDCTGTEKLSGTAQPIESVIDNEICTTVPDKNGARARVIDDNEDRGII